MILRALFLCSLALWCFSTKTQAQDTNGDNLQAALAKTIDVLEAQTFSPLTFDFDGDVVVEDADSHKAVTLPYLTIKMPDNTMLDIGFIAINAVPREANSGWDLALALPTPITVKNAQTGDTVNALHIGEQKTSLSWTNEDLLSAELTLNLSDMVFKDKDGIADPLFPNTAAYNISLNDVPLSDLVTIYTTSLQSVQAVPNLAPLTWLSLAIKVPNMLAQSGAKVTIKDTAITSTDYAAILEGHVSGNPQAKNLATGDMKLAMNGLNDLIEKMRLRMENAKTAKDKAQYESLLGSLSVLKTSSQVTGGDQNIAHQAHLKMTGDGGVTLNQEPYSLLGNIVNIPALLSLIMPQQKDKASPSE